MWYLFFIHYLSKNYIIRLNTIKNKNTRKYFNKKIKYIITKKKTYLSKSILINNNIILEVKKLIKLV